MASDPTAVMMRLHCVREGIEQRPDGHYRHAGRPDVHPSTNSLACPGMVAVLSSFPRRWPTLFRCERSESAPTMPPLIVNTQEIRKFVGLKAGPGDISVCWHDRRAALPLSVRKDLCGRGSLLDARKKAFITRRQVLFGDGATAVCHVGSAEGWDATDPWCSRDPGVDLSTN